VSIAKVSFRRQLALAVGPRCGAGGLAGCKLASFRRRGKTLREGGCDCLVAAETLLDPASLRVSRDWLATIRRAQSPDWPTQVETQVVNRSDWPEGAFAQANGKQA
jgi:hypothetical protein